MADGLFEGGPQKVHAAEEGVWHWFATADGTVDHAKWLRAIAERKPVGTCRGCGSTLKPRAPEQLPGRVDYEAVCSNTFTAGETAGGQRWVHGCGREVALPGGRLPRSARQSGQK